ncbi:MAG: dockerin type I repeat-containing protein [Anaerolineae bacterium]
MHRTHIQVGGLSKYARFSAGRVGAAWVEPAETRRIEAKRVTQRATLCTRHLLRWGIVLLLGLWLAIPPLAALAQSKDEELTSKLAEMAGLAEGVYDSYPGAVSNGSVVDNQKYQVALDHVHQMAAVFGSEGQDTDFEKRLQAISLVLGEQIEGQVYRLVRLVEDRREPDEVLRLLDDLAPNFNRVVLLAKGKIAPLEVRQLRSREAIQDAIAEIKGLVDAAVEAFRDGKSQEAVNLANEAFFTYESNGIGADTTLVDEPLENRVERAITNFADPEVNPGLEQLISSGAPLSQVEAKAREIADGLSVIETLLVGTLPEALRGDANDDGQVTIVDALFIAQAAVGLRSVDLIAADVNGDGRVSIVDALLVAQAAVGLREL